MDAKWVALGLYGLVAFQMGSDPQGTQDGIKGAFTSFNGVAKQVPVLFNSDGIGGSPAPDQPAPGYKVISLADGRQVQVPDGYRVVPTGD